MNDSTVDVQQFIRDLAQYMEKRDRITSAYAIVCSPVIYDVVHGAANPDGVNNSFSTKFVANHPWCPSETVYLPQTKDEYDSLMTSLDEYGKRMVGEICFFKDCPKPSSVVHDFGDKRMGFCEEHERQMKAFEQHFGSKG